MGFVEMVNSDGHIITLGDKILPSCSGCNDILEIDDTVLIVGMDPVRWKCEKCGCVNDQPKP